MRTSTSVERAARRPLGVLHVLGYAGGGGRCFGVTGVERVVESLLHGLGPEFRQSVVYPAAGLLQAQFRNHAASVVAAEPVRHFDAGFLRVLVGAIRSEDIDVVVSHGSRYDFHAALAARRTGVAHVVRRPVALADERFPRLRGALYAWIDGWTLRHAHAIVAVSESSKRRMVTTQHLPPQRIEVVPNGVACPVVTAAARSATRRALGAGDTTFVVGGVGQLIDRKAFHLVIEAVARLRPRDEPHTLVALVGDGPEAEPLRALARARDVRLELAGYHERPQEFVAAFDVMVLPSRAEGMPLVLLEAMALGVACIATPAAGTVEVIADGVTGSLVPFDDAVALAGALQRLRDDPALRRRHGAAAAAHIAARFSQDAMWTRYRALLQRAVAA